MDAVFRPHDGADSLRCRRDPILLLRVRQVPGSYTRPDSRVSLLGCSRCAMVLSRAKYSAYLLSASSRAVDLSLSFVCVLWEPDPSLEPMGVLHRVRLLIASS